MSEWLVSVSPADPADEIGRFAVAGEPEIDAAVARARRAFPAWRDAGFEARARVLRRFRDLAREGAEELARLIAREVGKALWDARAEAALVATKVELTLEHGMRFVAPIEAGAGARAEYLPRGVLARARPLQLPGPSSERPHRARARDGQQRRVQAERSRARHRATGWRASGAGPACPRACSRSCTGAPRPGARWRCTRTSTACSSPAPRPSAARSSRRCSISPASCSRSRWAGRTRSSCSTTRISSSRSPRARSRSARAPGSAARARAGSSSRAACSRSSRSGCVRVLRGVRIGPPLADGVFMGPLVSHAAHAKLLRYRALASEAGGERLLAVDPGLPAPFAGAGLVRFASTEAGPSLPARRDLRPGGGALPDRRSRRRRSRP